MATIIQIKRTTTANLPSTLEQGELAYLYDTSSTDTDAGGNGGRLYIGDPTSNSNTPLKIGGKYYTDMMDHAQGTLTASAAILTDSNSKIDNLKVDNLDLNGNAITSTNTNGDISITPNGAGKSIISNIYTDASTSLQEYIEDLTGGSITAGEGIDVTYDDAAGTTTIAGEDATSSNKGIASFGGSYFTVTSGDVAINDATTSTKGIASFATADFGVTSGAVSLDDAVVKTVTTDSGALTPSSHGLSVLGGEGMDVTHSGTTITVAGEDATTSNKGVASFDTNHFTVTSGAVTIKSGSIEDGDLAGSISNSNLANSSIVLGSDTVNLGDTITDVNGLTSLDVDNVTINGNVVSTTDTNGDLSLEPNGTGTVIVPSGYESRAGFQSQSLVNKAYVDSVANGLDVKASVKVATTADLSATYNNANGTLTATSNGAISIDGVSLSLNDRVLVKDQSTATENGFYRVTTVGSGSAAFVLTRTPDADDAAELTGGAFTFVEEGTANADNGYVASHNGTPTLGTDNITFEQFSGAGQIAAGDGLSKTGNTLDVNVDDSSIEIASDTLQVKALGVTNAMLAGSIANAKLANSSVTINGNSLALGGTLTLDTDDFAEGTNLFYTDERVDDRINALFVAGEGIDFTYDDANNTFTVDAELATSTNKGVASFHADNFTVTTGVVTVTGIDGGTY